MDRVTHQISASDGVTVSLDLYRHGSRDTVLVICPGFFKSKETATFQRMSCALANERDVLCMDFRGHGRSGGWYTFSAKEDADLAAVLSWAHQRYRRIGVLGFSLGAAVAINTVSRRPDRIQGLIAVSAPSAFERIEFKWWTREAIYRGLQGLEPGTGCRPGNLFLHKERPSENVQRLTDVPVLFVHGTRDVIVGARHSHELYAAASEPKRLEIIEGGSHAEALFRDEPEQFLRLVTGWCRQTLGG